MPAIHPPMIPAMRRIALAGALVLLPLAALAQTAPAPQSTPAAKDKVVARVDGAPITEEDIAVAMEDVGGTLPQMSPEQKRDYVVSYLTDLKLGAKAAQAAKLGDSPDFARRLAYYRDKVLVDELLSQETKKALTEPAMRKLYDETAKTLKPEEEVRARHILVENEDEAKKAYERVTAGKEDFAKVAGELSKDPGSGKEGGDLGYFSKDRMVPEFADAAFKLNPGQISQPVKSQFGWHVIKLEDKRTKPVPSFEEVKDQVSQYLARKAQTDLIVGLRSKAKVERLDKPAEAPKPDAAKPDASKPADPKKP